MSAIFPKTASVNTLQRSYRGVFNEVISSKEPIIILNKNKPEVVIVDMESYRKLREKADLYESEIAKQAIYAYLQNSNKENESIIKTVINQSPHEERKFGSKNRH
jgi:prevent-host-death family protein